MSFYIKITYNNTKTITTKATATTTTTTTISYNNMIVNWKFIIKLAAPQKQKSTNQTIVANVSCCMPQYKEKKKRENFAGYC